MTWLRRAAAPRLIDWTGERCVPWAPDVQVVYEHLHRYLWAADVVAGRRVLDLGSGEGFGASILATAAGHVVGVDIDETTVDHSQLNYEAGNLEFHVGTATDLSAFDDASFGAVVAFEVIEHIAAQKQVFEEISRVLAEDGVLIMSTPDRRTYSEASQYSNPFHERELTLEEFRELLSSHFQHHAVWGQRTITGSYIGIIPGHRSAPQRAGSAFFVERSGDEWRLAGDPSPLYLVAVASVQELPAIAAPSTLADPGLTLLHPERQRAARAEAEQAATRTELGRLTDEHARETHEHARETHQRMRQFERERSELVRALEDAKRGATAELERRDADLAEEESKNAGLRERIAALEAELQSPELASRLALARRTEESVTWQAFQRARSTLLGKIGGERALGARAIGVTLRMLGRLFLRKPKPPPAGPDEPRQIEEPEEAAELRILQLPECDAPVASLIIPVHAGAGLTEACLESILRNTWDLSYEVILVDDAADEETKRLLTRVRGATILVNESNVGYLRSVNRGAAVARGEWFVLCNNDTEVTPGWLDALLACGRSADDIGVVTPKYVYPDGRLNEAGAIVWRDGTGVNFGRGDAPDLHQYEYRRETDYGSAAALMVRADLFAAIGGFDERYLPMYYEDADLCFQARDRGLRVMYEPEAVVIHVEGGTAGTDPASGPKRYQELNRPKFVEKWRGQLDARHLRPAQTNVFRAADRETGPHVLVVDHMVPMWDHDAGSLRMLGILQGLRRLGCRVTLLPDNLEAAQPYTRGLQRMGIDVLYAPLDIRAQLATIGPYLHTAILSRPQVAARWLDQVREFAPSATVAYDTVDLHWLREARRSGLAEMHNGLSEKARALRELELAMIRATDITLVVTDSERQQVEADAPEARVLVVPTVHEIAATVAPVEGRSGVLFVGGFQHPPNADAAIRLVRDVMPAVWSQLGDVRVTIAGPGPPPEVQSLTSPLVDVVGWVEDLRPLLEESRVTVAPLRYGAGLKGKITQSLAAGLPVVTTSIGAEGLEASDFENMLVADEPRDLADRVIQVCRDDELWQQLSAAGQALASAMCSPEAIALLLRQLLDACEVQRAGTAGGGRAHPT